MFCSRCGKEAPYGSKFCVHCGVTLSNDYNTNSQNSTSYGETNKINDVAESSTRRHNGMAIVGFVCAFIVPLLGLILGVVGLSKSKKTKTGKAVSVMAIVVSLLIFVLNLIILS